MTTICWRCQQPGAEIENRRGEPVHRDCLAAYLPRPDADECIRAETVLQP